MIKASAAVISIAACGLAVVLAAACTINPQPLPPDTFDASMGSDGGARDQNGSADDAAATPTADTDGGNGGGGSIGDGGEGGDASADASDDGGILDAASDGSD